ncbi:hypothetical protein CsatB_013083 [Cannabis sativa]
MEDNDESLNTKKGNGDDFKEYNLFTNSPPNSPGFPSTVTRQASGSFFSTISLHHHDHNPNHDHHHLHHNNQPQERSVAENNSLSEGNGVTEGNSPSEPQFSPLNVNDTPEFPPLGSVAEGNSSSSEPPIPIPHQDSSAKLQEEETVIPHQEDIFPQPVEEETAGVAEPEPQFLNQNYYLDFPPLPPSQAQPVIQPLPPSQAQPVIQPPKSKT